MQTVWATFVIVGTFVAVPFLAYNAGRFVDYIERKVLKK